MGSDVQEGVACPRIGSEQGFDFVAKRGVGRAEACEEPHTLARAGIHRLVEGGFDLLPALGRHARKATRASRARSKNQRRLTTSSGVYSLSAPAAFTETIEK